MKLFKSADPGSATAAPVSQAVEPEPTTIRHRMILIAALVCGFVVSATVAAGGYYVWTSAASTLSERLAAAVRLVEAPLGDALAFSDAEAANRVLEPFGLDEPFVSAIVVNEEGLLLTGKARNGRLELSPDAISAMLANRGVTAPPTGAIQIPEANSIFQITPFVDETQAPAGYVAVEYSRASTTRRAIREVAWIIGSGVLFLLSVMFLLNFLLSRVTSPLESLTDAMRRLASGDLTATVPAMKRNDELGAIASALQHSLEILAHQFNRFHSELGCDFFASRRSNSFSCVDRVLDGKRLAPNLNNLMTFWSIELNRDHISDFFADENCIESFDEQPEEWTFSRIVFCRNNRECVLSFKENLVVSLESYNSFANHTVERLEWTFNLGWCAQSV